MNSSFPNTKALETARYNYKEKEKQRHWEFPIYKGYVVLWSPEVLLVGSGFVVARHSITKNQPQQDADATGETLTDADNKGRAGAETETETPIAISDAVVNAGQKVQEQVERRR